MITSAINYTKKKKIIMDRQKPRTNGKCKAVQTNHTKKHMHTHSQKEKKKKYIYIIKEESNQINKQIYQ